MSNFYSAKFDCVLIHIPKTGGRAIRDGFFKGDHEGPFFGYIPAKYSNCFKFAFVRNPFDRIISAWKMFTTGTDLVVSNSNMPLERFLEIVTDDSIIYDKRRKTLEEKIKHHTIPQTHRFNSLMEADFVGRFENFQEDFFRVCQQVGAGRVILPVVNSSSRCHYRNYYTSYTRAVVEKYFESDLQELGYEY